MRPASIKVTVAQQPAETNESPLSRTPSNTLSNNPNTNANPRVSRHQPSDHVGPDSANSVPQDPSLHSDHYRVPPSDYIQHAIAVLAASGSIDPQIAIPTSMPPQSRKASSKTSELESSLSDRSAPYVGIPQHQPVVVIAKHDGSVEPSRKRSIPVAATPCNTPRPKKRSRLALITWLLILKDIVMCIVKMVIFYRLVFALWPILNGSGPPSVTDFWNFLSGVSMGFVIMSYGDFIIVNVFFLMVLYLFLLVPFYYYWDSDHDKASSAPTPPPNHAETVETGSGGAGGHVLREDPAPPAKKEHHNPRWAVHLIYCHDKMHAMAYYSSFTYAIYWINELVSLKSIRAIFLLAKELPTTWWKWIYIPAMFIFMVVKSLFALFVIVFKLYFWSATITAVVNNSAMGVPSDLAGVQQYITLLIIVFDVLSLADMDYFILMNDFHLCRVLQGQRDSMIDIIAYNKPVTWYLNKFVYQLNYVKLQYLIKMSFIAASKDLSKSQAKLLRSTNFITGKYSVLAGVRARAPGEAASGNVVIGLPNGGRTQTIFQRMSVIRNAGSVTQGSRPQSQPQIGRLPPYHYNHGQVPSGVLPPRVPAAELVNGGKSTPRPSLHPSS